MAQQESGKHFRKGISFAGFMDRFPTDREAEHWFEQNLWSNGVHCHGCGSDCIHPRAEEKQLVYADLISVSRLAREAWL